MTAFISNVMTTWRKRRTAHQYMINSISRNCSYWHIAIVHFDLQILDCQRW